MANSENTIEGGGRDIEQQKEQLELERTRLELRRLQQPTRTALKQFGWKEITTFFVAFCGLFLAWLGGWFDVRQERLAIETANLQAQRDHLEQGNAQLEERRRGLESANATLI